MGWEVSKKGGKWEKAKENRRMNAARLCWIHL